MVSPTSDAPDDAAETSHAARPSLLFPPATIISPPSPVEPKTTHSIMFSSPPRQASPEPVTSDPSSSSQTIWSSDDYHLDRSQRLRGPSDSLGPMPLVASQVSISPTPSPRRESTTLLPPDSPNPSAGPSHVASPRSPSPSSPHYRPKRFGHRRESSTHKVRETTYGEQRSTNTGERMVNQYRIGRSLGRGAYASVELAVDVGTGKEYAIKEFSKSRLHYQSLQEKHRQGTRGRIMRARGKSMRVSTSRPVEDAEPREAESSIEQSNDPLALIRREIAVMKKLDHPNIVLLYEAISVSNADALFLVLEYMPGGVLMNVKLGDEGAESPFSIEQAREYFRQLCLGLEYLHANGVVHRDIKPDNVLVSADRLIVKLCDFGVSEMFVAQGDDRIKKSGGSPAFLSPESFAAHVNDVHGKAVDIWALGITLYCMLTGRLPWTVDNPLQIVDVVRSKEPPIPVDWDRRLLDLMRKMLEKKPETRIQMEEIRDHPWVTDDGSEPMIPTEDNLYYVGKHVEEPTQEELGNAIGTLRGVFTVIRAVQKMRRLQLHRRSVSGQTPPSPGSAQGSTAVSLTSGSMDSYASALADTAGTSASDANEGKGPSADGLGLLDGGICAEPEDEESGESGEVSPGATERARSDPPERLKINTDIQREKPEDQVVLVESPVDEG